MIIVKHEGVEIKYDEVRNRWTVNDGEHGITLDRQSLEEAKKGITQVLKKQQTGRFKRFKAWYSSGWGYDKGYRLVTVTSVVEKVDSYSSGEAWITYPKGKGDRRPDREKVMFQHLYKDTARNRQRVEKINGLRKQAEILDNKTKGIEGKLDALEKKENNL